MACLCNYDNCWVSLVIVTVLFITKKYPNLKDLVLFINKEYHFFLTFVILVTGTLFLQVKRLKD